jgi:hypothetical protein
MKVDSKPSDRRWAADQLGVAPDTPPAEARTVFLRRLPGSDFVPAPAWCAATAAFLGRALPGSIAAVPPADGDAARAAVAEFTERFWTLLPAERRGRWRELMDRTSADPLLAGRLQRLEAGLDLPNAVADSGPPRPREIAVMAQTLFVLDPMRRAARRREILDNLPPPASGWELAARHVQHNYPRHAALDPALITRLSAGARRVRPAARGISRPAATWGFQAQGGLHLPQSPPVFDRPKPKRKGSAWLTILLILLVVRAVGSLVSSAPDRPPKPAKEPLPHVGSSIELDEDLRQRLQHRRPGTPWTTIDPGKLRIKNGKIAYDDAEPEDNRPLPGAKGPSP